MFSHATWTVAVTLFVGSVWAWFTHSVFTADGY